MDKIKLSEIPDEILQFITAYENATYQGEIAWYNGKKILNVFKFDGQYRINTNKGQFRVNDAEIEIY